MYFITCFVLLIPVFCVFTMSVFDPLQEPIRKYLIHSVNICTFSACSDVIFEYYYAHMFSTSGCLLSAQLYNNLWISFLNVFFRWKHFCQQSHLCLHLMVQIQHEMKITERMWLWLLPMLFVLAIGYNVNHMCNFSMSFPLWFYNVIPIAERKNMSNVSWLTFDECKRSNANIYTLGEMRNVYENKLSVIVTDAFSSDSVYLRLQMQLQKDIHY